MHDFKRTKPRSSFVECAKSTQKCCRTESYSNGKLLPERESSILCIKKEIAGKSSAFFAAATKESKNVGKLFLADAYILHCKCTEGERKQKKAFV